MIPSQVLQLLGIPGVTNVPETGCFLGGRFLATDTNSSSTIRHRLSSAPVSTSVPSPDNCSSRRFRSTPRPAQLVLQPPSVATWPGVTDGPISQQCFLDHLLALASLRQITEQAKTRWSLVESAVVHRTGFFDLGAVAVSSAHRSPAFEAGQWIMDTIKQQTPIWKKEIYTDADHVGSTPQR